ncbi:uncharacterized protein LOC117600432 isoform X1 [Osmia lignaria lignaria]|uniref:uncharacterized protein LOC117600432 isoform X1 n=1 Tax=Osmia lignaria lignaria TaxID=1437193 RepID=UPI00402BB931
MFAQRQSYFYRLTRSYPILKLVDIYDRQSFIRAYVLDNVYVCILMHILFYLALWFATTVIKKMEKSNKEMLKIMGENRTKLQDVTALKDKKSEYDEVVVKVKEAQKITSEELENEMQRLSTELITAANKLSELESIIEKLIFSTNCAGNRAKYLRAMSLIEKPSLRRTLKEGRDRSRISRFSSRPSHHPYHRNLHLENMGSLSLDLLGNVVHLPLHLQLRPQNSDSSNCASVEASSESAIHRQANRVVWSGGDRRYGDRRKKRRGKSSGTAMTSRFNVRKLHSETLRNITPFTKSLLGLATIFTKEKF